MMMYCWNPSPAHSTERKWVGTLGWAVLIVRNRLRWLRSTAPTLRNICNVQWWIQCSDKWIQLDSPFIVCNVQWWSSWNNVPIAWIQLQWWIKKEPFSNNCTQLNLLITYIFLVFSSESSWSSVQTSGTTCLDLPFIICNVNAVEKPVHCSVSGK